MYKIYNFFNQSVLFLTKILRPRDSRNFFLRLLLFYRNIFIYDLHYSGLDNYFLKCVSQKEP
jgi:hypothetical protein